MFLLTELFWLGGARPGDERLWLFDNLPKHNPARELETETDFLI
jgi:hypothetical protein